MTRRELLGWLIAAPAIPAALSAPRRIPYVSWTLDATTGARVYDRALSGDEIGYLADGGSLTRLDTMEFPVRAYIDDVSGELVSVYRDGTEIR